MIDYTVPMELLEDYSRGDATWWVVGYTVFVMILFLGFILHRGRKYD